MIDWAGVWTVVIVAAIIAYFGLGIAITIGGFYDVLRMFRRLDEAQADRDRAAGAMEAPDEPTKRQ